MDRRRVYANYAVNLTDHYDTTIDSDSDDANKKTKYSLSTSTWAGICMSAAILLTFIVILGTRMDIIHIALSHESTFHANHIPENHIDVVLNRKPSQSIMSSQAIISAFAPSLAPTTSFDAFRGDANKGVMDTAVSEDSIDILQTKVKQQIELVYKLKFEDHLVMEQDEIAKREIQLLQELLRKFIPQKYGPEPYQVEMTLRFPDTMRVENRADTEIVLFELGPIQLVPYSTYKFLEIIETFKGGAFHRRAGHVLQAMVNSQARHLAFQEYHPKFPHVKNTLGYAGRPGGPEFYISTVDNSWNHGPASQGSKTEADSCFGKIVDGFDVVARMQKQPGGAKGSGFVEDSKNFIRITSLKLVR
jgi:cyclophilin family peptidyl-prolyl cis-trans isomerase